ncbi:MAG: hypothetical protein H0U79_08945 [Solirubrobacterales bacterium]|nr:hypothetical protein [Solirubrobacterales bacterium]
MFVQPLLCQALSGGHDALALRRAHEGAVLFQMPAIRAGQFEFVGKRLVLGVAHLERRLARRAFAAEEALLVERDGDRSLETVLGRLDVSDALRLGQMLPAHR